MKIATTLRNRLAAAAAFGLLLAVLPMPAHAASKEMVELQTQVQQLLDMVQRLQSTLDTRLGVIQHMVEGANEATSQMATTVNALQVKINAQSEAGNGKLDTVSGQVQSLNDSVDELKSRIAKLDKNVQDLQAQLQAMQAPSATAGQAGQPGDPNAPQGAIAPAASVAPPLKDTYQAGVRDLNAAHYDVAASEFQDVLKYYPNDDLAGGAQFYLGEIAYHQENYADAVTAYTAVIEGFPGSSKAPAAQLKKGFALLQLNKKDAGIHELRTLIQRHPQTPEADQARKRLNGMGIRIAPPAH